MNWKRIVFGGAGPKANSQRRIIIDQVKEDLEMWRDTDNDTYRLRAIQRMENAK